MTVCDQNQTKFSHCVTPNSLEQAHRNFTPSCCLHLQVRTFP